MARKDEKSEEQASEEEQQLANRIKDSARQIWLAGLGAYTKAEEDTGKFLNDWSRKAKTWRIARAVPSTARSGR